MKKLFMAILLVSLILYGCQNKTFPIKKDNVNIEKYQLKNKVILEFTNESQNLIDIYQDDKLVIRALDHNSISILSFSKDQYKDDIIKTISIKKNKDAEIFNDYKDNTYVKATDEQTIILDIIKTKPASGICEGESVMYLYSKETDAKTKKPVLLDIISKKIILDKDKTTITVKNEWDKPSQKFDQVTFRTRFYTYKK